MSCLSLHLPRNPSLALFHFFIKAFSSVLFQEKDSESFVLSHGAFVSSFFLYKNKYMPPLSVLVSFAFCLFFFMEQPDLVATLLEKKSSTFRANGHESDIFFPNFFLGCGQSMQFGLTESKTHLTFATAPVSRQDGFGYKNEETAQHRSQLIIFNVLARLVLSTLEMPSLGPTLFVEGNKESLYGLGVSYPYHS